MKWNLAILCGLKYWPGACMPGSCRFVESNITKTLLECLPPCWVQYVDRRVAYVSRRNETISVSLWKDYLHIHQAIYLPASMRVEPLHAEISRKNGSWWNMKPNSNTILNRFCVIYSFLAMIIKKNDEFRQLYLISDKTKHFRARTNPL
jgi:hypothetical protein